MSAVTARLVNAVQPAPTTKPRIARGLSLMFKLVDGEMKINAISNTEDTICGWLLAKPNRQPYVELGKLVIPSGTHNSHAQAALTVFQNPTETVPAPTPEPTVVLEMPLEIAKTVASAVGASIPIKGTYGEHASLAFHALRDAGVTTGLFRFKNTLAPKELGS